LAAPARTARVQATDVRADRVLVIVDNSGSMAGTADAVEAQLSQLRAAGISIANRVNVPGFAISFTDQYSLFPAIIERASADKSIDAVYVISDFSQGDDEGNEPAAVERLSRILRDRRMRVYWASVRENPGAIYYRLARTSGGDVIGMK
jgi:hypothetical protein